MKTKMIIPLVVLLLCFQQAIQAQNLKGKIEKSVVEIGTTFTEIPMERLQLLDQITFTLFKNMDDDEKTNVIFIDKDNQEISQLAMVWLQTGMLYYGHGDMFNIQSAGLTSEMKPITGLTSLNQYGFNVRNTRRENPMSYRIKYGSDSWVVFPKTLESLGSMDRKIYKIFLEENTIDNSEKNEIELLFSDYKAIPREMLYMATRFDNLLKTKK